MAKELAASLKKACEESNIIKVSEILASDGFADIPGEDLGEAFVLACKNGMTSTVQTFVALQGFIEKIPGKAIGNAFQWACKNSHEEIVLTLLAQPELMKKVPDEDGWKLGDGLINLSKGGLTSAVQAFVATVDLLKKLPDDPADRIGIMWNTTYHSYGLGNALVNACRKGHEAIVTTFLASPTVLEKLPFNRRYGLGDALLNACKNGHEAIVTSFLANPTVLEKLQVNAYYGLGNVLKVACSEGHETIVKNLLDNPKILDEITGNEQWGLGDALVVACTYKQAAIARSLLTNPTVLEKITGNGGYGLGSAFVKACSNGAYTVVTYFLDNPTVMSKIPINGIYGIINGIECANNTKVGFRNMMNDETYHNNAIDYNGVINRCTEIMNLIPLYLTKLKSLAKKLTNLQENALSPEDYHEATLFRTQLIEIIASTPESLKLSPSELTEREWQLQVNNKAAELYNQQMEKSFSRAGLRYMGVCKMFDENGNIDITAMEENRQSGLSGIYVTAKELRESREVIEEQRKPMPAEMLGIILQYVRRNSPTQDSSKLPFPTAKPEQNSAALIAIAATEHIQDEPSRVAERNRLFNGLKSIPEKHLATYNIEITKALSAILEKPQSKSDRSTLAQLNKVSFSTVLQKSTSWKEAIESRAMSTAAAYCA